MDFLFEVCAADRDRRVIEGTGVPWDETAVVPPVGRLQFARGSLSPLRRRTPLLLGHDGEPVGVLVQHTDTDEGARVLFQVDETPEGDRALAQAASGSRGGISVGAEVVNAEQMEDGTLRVTEAQYAHFALVPHGAFAGAEVSRVAAALETPEPPDAEPPDDDDAGEPAARPDDPEVHPMQETLDTEVEAAAPRIRVAAERPRVELSAGELVAYMIRAQHGEEDARRFVAAALAETISTDVTGLLPPQYERTVIGAQTADRTLYNVFRGRPLPGVGLLVSKPKWTTRPDGQWAASVDADATSTKVVVGSQTADVIRWDWAGAISWVVVQRSDPSIIDEIYAEAVQDFYLDVEAKIYGEIGAAAVGVATTLGAALAEFYTATGNQRGADVILMAPDVWGAFADVGQLSVPLAQGDASASGGFTMSFGGIRAETSPLLAPGEVILATRRAVDARITDPVRLTANAIGALNVELAVVGEGLFDTDYPGELLKFAAIVPASAGVAATRTSTSTK